MCCLMESVGLVSLLTSRTSTAGDKDKESMTVANTVALAVEVDLENTESASVSVSQLMWVEIINVAGRWIQAMGMSGSKETVSPSPAFSLSLCSNLNGSSTTTKTSTTATTRGSDDIILKSIRENGVNPDLNLKSVSPPQHIDIDIDSNVKLKAGSESAISVGKGSIIPLQNKSLLRLNAVLNRRYPFLSRPQLFSMPSSYAQLHSQLTAISGLSFPALCLICGAVMDANGKGNCAAHSKSCNNDGGIMFLLQVSQSIFIRETISVVIQFDWMSYCRSRIAFSFSLAVGFIDALYVELFSTCCALHEHPNLLIYDSKCVITFCFMLSLPLVPIPLLNSFSSISSSFYICT